MRKARIRAEMDQQVLKEKNRQDRQLRDTMATERYTANHLYSNYNSNFDANEKMYEQRLGKSI